MEQEWQNDAGALTAQAIPQKDVEQACFHALGLVGRNCEYLEQHLARVGADEQTRQAVNDISAAAARLDRTMNEVMTLLDFLRAEEPPQLSPLDLCQMLPPYGLGPAGRTACTGKRHPGRRDHPAV